MNEVKKSSMTIKKQIKQIIASDEQKELIVDKNLFVDHLLQSVKENIPEKNYLSDKTLDTISEDIFNVVKNTNIPNDVIKEIVKKLTNYRYVDKICEMHVGKHVRWINKNNPGVLLNGGTVLKISFSDNGCFIIIKNNTGKIFQYKFDDCLSFHKLTSDEQLILISSEFANATSVELYDAIPEK